ncbi:phosphatidate phosphatase LPIN1 isoform X3 [Hydra vulgaris]|uniref:phosphatidate phosphatase n=1 Tax=Hydra vulgaris TaxID=6087 RepID=A0ABM4BQJ8_HYDVU
MHYIGNFAKSVAGLYNQINSATLTGAIDIMVIKHPDGTYVGSPFHVRFGKLGVLRSREKIVDVMINDEEVNLHMKLGEAGEAFFVETVKDNECVPSQLATSPIPSPTIFFQHLENKYAVKDEKTKTEVSITDNHNVLCKSQSISIPGNHNYAENEKYWSYEQPEKLKSYSVDLTSSRVQYPLSDMDSPISSPLSMSPSESHLRTVFSDTETPSVENAVEQDITWLWGQLPENKPKTPRSVTIVERRKKTKEKKLESEGLLLADVLAADKDVADIYLHRGSGDELDSGFDWELTNNDETKEQSKIYEKEVPTTDKEEIGEVELSLCGDLKNRRLEPENFKKCIVNFEEFCRCPSLLHDPKLVIRINESYYNWAVAAPYLMSYVVFQKPIVQECLNLLKKQYMPKKRKGWFYWRTTNDDSSDDENLVQPAIYEHQHNLPIAEVNDSDAMNRTSDGFSDCDIEYRKTLRLTSKQWKALNLKYGPNKVTFSVTTRLQGTAECSARIFLWDYSDKIIISDIDGTITKSDVLGQILPHVGKDWSQSGVTELFTQIKKNGYKFIYLSARAIGQASMTREFLNNVRQGQMELPDGPLFLTPTSLFVAFKKEVIDRKPEEFKISCMRDILNLFPSDINPFHSGFGNRVNDMWAYRAVGIPISRIFTINYKGEVKHELTFAYTSSYNKLIQLVDQMFPPLSSKSMCAEPSQFTAFSYWRNPIPPLNVSDVEEEIEFP